MLDFETKTSFDVTVEVDDTTVGGTPDDTASYTLSITDVNDVVPVVTSGQSFNLAENTANGTAVGTVVATDGDVTPTTFSEWTIVGGAPRSRSTPPARSPSPTKPVGPRGDHQLQAPDDRVGRREHQRGGGSHHQPDRPERRGARGDRRPTFDVAENSGDGTVVGTVVATDGDVTATTFQDWTIVSDGSVFAIDSAGEITVADSSQLDRETASSFTLQVTVSDGVNTSAAVTVTIQLTDVNDVVPVITASQTFALAENTATDGGWHGGHRRRRDGHHVPELDDHGRQQRPLRSTRPAKSPSPTASARPGGRRAA